MVVVPGKFIFLATPRTGSRAVKEALLKYAPGAVESREHHTHPGDIDSTAEKLLEGSSDLPRFSVIRDPYDQARSMFYHAHVRHMPTGTDPTSNDFIKWLGEFGVGKGANPWWFNTTLYPYKDHSDRIFEYWRHLVRTIFAAGGLCQPPGIDWVGASKGAPENLMNEQARAAVDERFGDDVEFFNTVFETGPLRSGARSA